MCFTVTPQKQSIVSRHHNGVARIFLSVSTASSIVLLASYCIARHTHMVVMTHQVKSNDAEISVCQDFRCRFLV